MAAQMRAAAGQQHGCPARSALDVARERRVVDRAWDVCQQLAPLVGAEAAECGIRSVQVGVAVQHDHCDRSVLATSARVLPYLVAGQVGRQPHPQRGVVRDLACFGHGRHGRRV